MEQTQETKRLVLEHKHREAGATFAPFAGYAMPVKYEGFKAEHFAVRERAGLFDVSHMGEVEVTGPDAIASVDRLVTNDVASLVDGQALYTVMCREDGGIIDDLIVYRLGASRVFICINAARDAVDWAHMQAHATGDAEWRHRSADFVQLAVQGPASEAIVGAIAPDATSLGGFRCAELEVAGALCLVARTGYTGEDGFEVYAPVESAEVVFDALVAAGRGHGMAMCGLGCRDTLRLEAKLHLYGQDMDEGTNPYEAGLGWTVKLGKAQDFVGKRALERLKAQGVKRRLRGLVVQGRQAPRTGYAILADGAQVGHVTSGTYSYTLEQSIGLGYVDAAHANDEVVQVQIRAKTVDAKVVKKPFYVR
ncbi:MAG: glycine cleavage system aminomethyltransferase GcvT [Myxococcota bacterium]